MVRKRRRARARGRRALLAFVLMIGVAALSIWGLWRLTRTAPAPLGVGSRPETTAGPGEEIRPGEKARLDEVLEDLGENSGATPDRR
jgi:hypothetical protein